MQSLKAAWYKVPLRIRQVIVFVVGMFFILAAIVTSPLPGPGGIPLFLIGIAILATEFVWAQRIRDRIMIWLKTFRIWFRTHRTIAWNGIFLGLSFMVLALTLYFGQR